MNGRREIRVHMEWDPETIYVVPVDYYSDKKIYSIPTDDGRWKQMEVPYNHPSEVLGKCLRFDREDAEKLYYGLAKIFGKYELQPKQAELDAVRYHLEDMRRLAFKRK